MKRTAPILQANVTQADAGLWFETNGFVHSVEAMLAPGATAAVIDIYGSNIGKGAGVKFATITLSAGTPTDGFTAGIRADGWMYVRSQVVSTTGGVAAVAACVGEA